MYLTRIIYCSELSGVGEDDIKAILEVSRKNNEQQAISGMLLFNGTYFLQCLEGGRRAVNETYQRIMRDERHAHPVLLAYEEIVQRSFGDWQMAYVPWTKEVRNIIRTFSVSDEFNPYQLRGQSAVGLFCALSERLPAQEHWTTALCQG